MQVCTYFTTPQNLMDERFLAATISSTLLGVIAQTDGTTRPTRSNLLVQLVFWRLTFEHCPHLQTVSCTRTSGTRSVCKTSTLPLNMFRSDMGF